MKLAAYYNELDPKAAVWLRELIKAKVITDGEVDERSIEDVLPADLAGFTRCHFFAGIGVWDYALGRAGFPDDHRVWTGSCPCQPFSAAGKGEGFADERHLWPAWNHLIDVCRPDAIFGEQVASKDGLTWLDLVSTDLEGVGYTIAPLDLPAAGFGAPHIRQRIFFVADLPKQRNRRLSIQQRRQDTAGHPHFNGGGKNVILADTLPTGRAEGWAESRNRQIARGGGFSEMGIANGGGLDGRPIERSTKEPGSGAAIEATSGTSGVALGDTLKPGLERLAGDERNRNEPGRLDADQAGSITPAGFTNGFWQDAEWAWCRDRKYRPTKPGLFPLANGVAGRVGLLRGYGNAINAEVATEFIKAYLEL